MLKLEPEVGRQPLLSGTPGQQGGAIYATNCKPCHGADLKGQPPAVPSLIHIAESKTAQYIKATVKQGKEPMPGFPSLSNAELNSLIAYLRDPSSGRGAAEEEIKAPSPGDPHRPLRYRSGFGYMSTSTGLPPIRPPWTSLTAYDLNEGTIKWKIPLGEVPELARKGITNTGAQFPKGGPVVTAGGVVFTQTRDRKVRAFDEDTGKELWQAELPAALEGVPAVYEANGREYVVFCAAAPDAGYGKSPGAIHGAYVAFALDSAVQ